jgi:hypothetical protein
MERSDAHEMIQFLDQLIRRVSRPCVYRYSSWSRLHYCNGAMAKMNRKRTIASIILIFVFIWPACSFGYTSDVGYQQEIVGFKTIWDRAFGETASFVLPAGWSSVPGSDVKIYISKNRLKISTLPGRVKLRFVRAWLVKDNSVPMGVEPYAWLFVQLDIEYDAITKKSYKCDARKNNRPFGTVADPHHFYVCMPRTILFSTSVTIGSGPISYRQIEKKFITDAKGRRLDSPAISFYGNKIKKSFPVWEIEDYDNRLKLLFTTDLEYCSECVTGPH